MMTMIMPLVLISFLGLCTFMIPAESPGKLGFAAAILIAEVLLLGVVAEDVPMSGRTIPILGMYRYVQSLVS